MFFKEGRREGERAEEERGRKTLAPPCKGLKTDPTLVIYKILEETLVL
jgi:hypothetical protein